MLRTVNLDILSGASIFNYTRLVAGMLDIKDSSVLNGYYCFMDNLYLYSLISDQYIYSFTLSCLTATLVYFTAKDNAEIKQRVLSLFKRASGTCSVATNKIKPCKDFVLKKLKELGADDQEISFLQHNVPL